MKVTYWCAPCLIDSRVYSIRERTKRAALAKLEELSETDFGPVRKVTVEYDNAFDLLEYVASEAFFEGHDDEANPVGAR